MQDNIQLLVAIIVGVTFAVSFLKGFFRSSGKRKTPPLPGVFRATNPYVIDGDTLSIAGARIRLAGIDAPERGQAQGQDATSHLRHLLSAGEVQIVPLTYDKYGRIVARVICEGRDICRQMVIDGYAISDDFTRSYKAEMKRAKRSRSGLWAKGGIQNPRAFRKSLSA
jgi:endonuclease YncB( thermonuclease family)